MEVLPFCVQLGFGKSMPTNCVWLDGLSTNVTDQYLTRHFCRYGPVVKVGGRLWRVVWSCYCLPFFPSCPFNPDCPGLYSSGREILSGA